ncbi:MAG: hypothetical protein M3R02_26525 [Chloroflexota bacterium]|nr:hypothetical protein [Chloroflexota bacterium]
MQLGAKSVNTPSMIAAITEPPRTTLLSISNAPALLTNKPSNLLAGPPIDWVHPH